MVALVRSRGLDFADTLPSSARAQIKALLAVESKATRRVYSALARKVWSLLIERRFDPEVRDWHALLNGVIAHVREMDAAAAERITALADLLRESISLAETSPAQNVAARPRARRILEVLHKERGFAPRRALMQKLDIGNSHLSNILTPLVAHNLIERRENGREAEFQITRIGREMLRESNPAEQIEPLVDRLRLINMQTLTTIPTFPKDLSLFDDLLVPNFKDNSAHHGIYYGDNVMYLRSEDHHELRDVLARKKVVTKSLGPWATAAR